VLPGSNSLLEIRRYGKLDNNTDSHFIFVVNRGNDLACSSMRSVSVVKRDSPFERNFLRNSVK
jgi:hypothetical protein